MAENVETPGLPVSSYDTGIAGKKIAWGLAKFAAAQALTPTSINAFETICSHLKPLGITVVIDRIILSQALPGFIFMFLVATHDWMKVKTGKNWL